MSLECKACGFTAENGDLIPHLQTKHKLDAPALKKYMDANGGRDSVITPEAFAREKAREAKSMKGPTDEVVIQGVSLRKRSGLSNELKLLIPKENPHYEYQAFVADFLHDIKVDNNIALTGHCGTGKTSLITQIAAKVGAPVIRVNTNQQTSQADFVGYLSVKAENGGTSMEWIDGALPYAMRNGCWLIIDEIDYAEPAILSALNAVLERNGTRSLMLKEKGNEIVQAHPDFRIFATGNTLGQMSEYRSLYQGTGIMNEAFNDRWPSLYLVDYLNEEQEAKVLSESIPALDIEIAKMMVNVASRVRKSFTEENMQCTMSTRRLLDWGEMICRKSGTHLENAPMAAAESTIFSKISRVDAAAFRGYLELVFLGGQ